MTSLYSSNGDLFLQMAKGDEHQTEQASWLGYLTENKGEYSFSPELWNSIDLSNQVNALIKDGELKSIPELKELVAGSEVETTLDALTLSSDFLRFIDSNSEAAVNYFISNESLCPVWSIKKYSEICKNASHSLTKILEDIESNSSAHVDNVKELNNVSPNKYLDSAINANEQYFKAALDTPKSSQLVSNTKTLELASLSLQTLGHAFKSPFMNDQNNISIKQAYQSKLMDLVSDSKIPQSIKAESIDAILEVSLASHSHGEDMPSLAKLGSLMTKLHHMKLPQADLLSIQETLGSTLSNRDKAEKAHFYIETPEHGDRINFKSNMKQTIKRT